MRDSSLNPTSKLLDLYQKETGFGTVFLHGNRSRIGDEKRYLDRGIILARSQDHVFVEDIDESYLQYLTQIGFEIPNLITVKPTNECLADLILKEDSFNSKFKNLNLSVFADVLNQQRLSNYLGTNFNCSNDENKLNKLIDKSHFQQLAQKLNIPIVLGTVHDLTQDSSIHGLKDSLELILSNSQQTIVRANKGSGKNYIVNPQNQGELIPEILSQGIEKLLIDPFLNVVESPNLTFYIDQNGQSHFLSLSNQVQDGLVYLGNDFIFNSSRYNHLIQHSQKLVDFAKSIGYRGVLGVDFITTDENKSFVCEVNLRINGNNYGKVGYQRATEITGKNSKAVSTSKLKLNKSYSSFQQFQKQFNHLLFDGKKESSVLVYNTELLKDSQINAIFMGESSEEISFMKSQFK